MGGWRDRQGGMVLVTDRLTPSSLNFTLVPCRPVTEERREACFRDDVLKIQEASNALDRDSASGRGVSELVQVYRLL